MAFDWTSGFVGAAAGWLGQWFLIDRPVYRKLDSAQLASSPATNLEADLAKKNDEIASLKAQIADLESAYRSTKAEGPGEHDDLEPIDGIGPVFERKLYAAGITTYKELAKSTPERIREAIQPQKWQKIEPEKWIAEAADRAKGKKK